MSTEIEIEVAEFEAKCKKLNALLKSGMITKEELSSFVDINEDSDYINSTDLYNHVKELYNHFELHFQ